MTDLNPRQQATVHYIDGPLLVLAGAGSGKTRVITTKIGHLVKQCGIEPGRSGDIYQQSRSGDERAGDKSRRSG